MESLNTSGQELRFTASGQAHNLELPPALVVKNLTKTFGKRDVLHNLSFEVPACSSLAIIGPSGCGKSTLLNIIGMLEQPTSGQVVLEGKTLPAINSAAATRLRRYSINYLFQSYALISSMSAFDNVMLGLHYSSMSKQEKEQQVNVLLDRLGMAHVKSDVVASLSGGEQQRVALARCILKPGNILLADEPTGALDPKLAQQVLSEMLNLQHEYNKTLIIVTHDLRVAQQCDRILDLSHNVR